MRTAFTPTLLTDKSRLQEIYDLRVDAWENSELREFVNRTYFPNGWKDNLDDDAFHFIVEHENKIIASARVSIHRNAKDLKVDFNEALFTWSDTVRIFFKTGGNPEIPRNGDSVSNGCKTD